MAACPVCGARARTADQRFCRICGSALARPEAGAMAAPAAGGRSWAAVVGPLAVAVVCLTTLTLLVDWILTGGGEVRGVDDTFPQPSPTAYASPEVSVTSEMPSPTESTDTSPTESTESTPTESNETSELLKHIPPAIAVSCVEDPGFKELSKGLQAAVGCEHFGPGHVDKITYLLYDSDSSMEAAYQYVVERYTSGTLQKKSGCQDGPARGPWDLDYVEAGSFACYVSSTSGVRLWWSTDGTGILARASDEDMSVPQLWTWFLKTYTGPF
jgi:hypothetical protein